MANLDSTKVYGDLNVANNLTVTGDDVKLTGLVTIGDANSTNHGIKLMSTVGDGTDTQTGSIYWHHADVTFGNVFVNGRLYLDSSESKTMVFADYLGVQNDVQIMGTTYSDGEIIIANATAIKAFESDGTTSRNIANITSANNLDLGDSLGRTVILSSQVPSWYTGGTFNEFIHTGGGQTIVGDLEASSFTEGGTPLSSKYARLNTTGQSHGYLYIRRNDTNSALYVNQRGTGDIARFIQGSSDTSTNATTQVLIKNNGDVDTTGQFIEGGVALSSKYLEQTGGTVTGSVTFTNISASPIIFSNGGQTIKFTDGGPDGLDFTDGTVGTGEWYIGQRTTDNLFVLENSVSDSSSPDRIITIQDSSATDPNITINGRNLVVNGDLSVANFDAGDITTGTIDEARLPTTLSNRYIIDHGVVGEAALIVARTIDDATDTPTLIVANDGEDTDVIAEFRGNGAGTSVDISDAANSVDARVQIMGDGLIKANALEIAGDISFDGDLVGGTDSVNIIGTMIQNGYPVVTHDQEEANPKGAISDLLTRVCMQDGTIYAYAWEDDTRVYVNNILTFKKNAGDYWSWTASEGDIIETNNRPVSMNAYDRSVASIVNAACKFVSHTPRATYLWKQYRFYAPYADATVQIKVDSDDFTTPDYTWNVSKGTTATFEIDLNNHGASDNSIIRIISDTPVIVISAQSASSQTFSTADRVLLNPPSREVIGGNHTSSDRRTTFDDGASYYTSNNKLYNSTSLMQVFGVADGGGGDSECGLPSHWMADHYAIPHPADGYAILAIEPCIVNVYRMSDDTLYATHDLSAASRATPVEIEEGVQSGTGTDLDAVGFYFVGSGRFKLRTNVTAGDDEYVPLGWNSRYRESLGDVLLDYDSFEGNQSILMKNNVQIQGETTGGSPANLILRDTNNRTIVGTSAQGIRLHANSVPQWWNGTDAHDIIHTGGGQAIAGTTDMENLRVNYVSSDDLTGANKQVIHPSGANLYFGNNTTHLQVESSDVPTVRIGSSVYDILHTGGGQTVADMVLTGDLHLDTNNGSSIYGRTTSDTLRLMMRMDNNNRVRVGDSNTQVLGLRLDSQSAPDWWDGTTIRTFLHTGGGQTLNGGLTAGGNLVANNHLHSNGGALYVNAANAAGNAHLWMRDENNNSKGLAFWSRSSGTAGQVKLRAYNADASAYDEIAIDPVQGRTSFSTDIYTAGNNIVFGDTGDGTNVDYLAYDDGNNEFIFHTDTTPDNPTNSKAAVRAQRFIGYDGGEGVLIGLGGDNAAYNAADLRANAGYSTLYVDSSQLASGFQVRSHSGGASFNSILQISHNGTGYLGGNEIIHAGGGQTVPNLVISDHLTVDGLMQWDNGKYILQYGKHFNVSSYWVDTEYFEIMTITPGSNSRNYYITGQFVFGNSQNTEFVDFYWSVRSDTLPSIATNLHVRKRTDDSSTTPQFVEWYDSANGVIKLLVKHTGGADVHNASAMLTFHNRGNYTSDIDLSQESELTAIEAGFTETAYESHAWLDSTSDVGFSGGVLDGDLEITGSLEVYDVSVTDGPMDFNTNDGRPIRIVNNTDPTNMITMSTFSSNGEKILSGQGGDDFTISNIGGTLHLRGDSIYSGIKLQNNDIWMGQDAASDIWVGGAGTNIGFFGVTPVSRRNVSSLADLGLALEQLGLINDNSGGLSSDVSEMVGPNGTVQLNISEDSLGGSWTKFYIDNGTTNHLQMDMNSWGNGINVAQRIGFYSVSDFDSENDSADYWYQVRNPTTSYFDQFFELGNRSVNGEVRGTFIDLGKTASHTTGSTDFVVGTSDVTQSNFIVHAKATSNGSSNDGHLGFFGADPIQQPAVNDMQSMAEALHDLGLINNTATYITEEVKLGTTGQASVKYDAGSDTIDFIFE